MLQRTLRTFICMMNTRSHTHKCRLIERPLSKYIGTACNVATIVRKQHANRPTSQPAQCALCMCIIGSSLLIQIYCSFLLTPYSPIDLSPNSMEPFILIRRASQRALRSFDRISWFDDSEMGVTHLISKISNFPSRAFL